MTYDPYRDPYRNEPPDGSDLEYRDYRNEDRAAAGAAILLGALLLAAIGGFIYFNAGTGDRVATTDLRPPITQPSTTGSAPAPETTGSSANMPPMPQPRIEPRVKPVE